MIAKMLGAAVVVISLCLSPGAGPAAAEPAPPEPNPFGGLTCACQGPSPAEAPSRATELERGLQGPHGLADYYRHGRMAATPA